MSSSAMARLNPKGLPIHLLTQVGSDDVGCAAEDVTYVSTNPAVVTCAACLAGDDEPLDVEPVLTVLTPPIAVGVSTPGELRAWRTRHKLSQRALAALLDVRGLTVHRWEAGSSPLPHTVSLALAYLDQHLP